MSETELRAAVKAALREHNASLRTLERRVRLLTTQRDRANGRVRELRDYVSKYQRELAVLKKEARRA